MGKVNNHIEGLTFIDPLYPSLNLMNTLQFRQHLSNTDSAGIEGGDGGEEIVNGDVTTTERNTERTRTTRGGDPKTGDTTPIGLMLLLMGLSLAAILLAVRRRKRS
jgi:LPXTG-motif cell wall-anchored protein